MHSSKQVTAASPAELDIEKSLSLAIQNVCLDGFTDVFEHPFERDFLRIPKFVSHVQQWLLPKIKARSYEQLEMRPAYYTLQPKSRRAYEFRKVALIEPMDSIKYLTLAILCASKIEQARIPKDQSRVFSYRFLPGEDGRIWDSDWSIQSFYEYAQKQSKDEGIEVVVHCDIANFYDRLNLHRLESTLQDVGVEPWLTKCLNELLSVWSRRDSYGLPVGSNASRMLAEAALIEVDKYLLEEGVNFCRFVDDYRFFAPNVQTAQNWLCKLLNRLFSEGLTLNSSKTRVRPAKLPDQELDTAEKDLLEVPKRGFVPKLGYGRIPRRFFPPNEEALAALRDSNQGAGDVLADIKANPVVEGDRFELFVRLIVAKEDFEMLVNVPEILKKCPPFTDYVVDALSKYKDRVSSISRQKIAQELGDFLSLDLPEWHAAQIVKLLSMAEYQNPSALRKLRRSLRKDSGVYLTRILTEGLENFSNRGDQYELKNAFERAEPWEQRSILRIFRKILPEEEHKAWVRSIAIQVRDDPFAEQIVKPFDSRRPTKSAKVEDASSGEERPSQGLPDVDTF